MPSRIGGAAVINCGAFGAGDDAAAAKADELTVIGLRRKMVREVEPAQFRNVVIAGHVPLYLGDERLAAERASGAA